MPIKKVKQHMSHMALVKIYLLKKKKIHVAVETYQSIEDPQLILTNFGTES